MPPQPPAVPGIAWPLWPNTSRLFMEAPEPTSEEPRARRATLWKAPSGRQWPVLAACLTCCTLLGWYTANSVKDAAAFEGPWPEEEDPETETTVTVLVWWRPFGRGIISGGCWQFNISGCRLSTNRSFQRKAHAVLIHHRDLQAHGLGQLPRQRPPNQRWVWMNFESPTHTKGLRNLGGLFNWTMSYREDSDVFVPYGYLKLRPEPLVQFTLPKKTKLVAWVISNWNEGHARVRYYHQLKKYLPIDVYGSHRLSLKDNSVVKTISKYKFYLAFENSQHQDYITEKLWRNAFESWAVPIVLGPPRANYERFMPSDAFIHADDFSDPMELALYLRLLDKNKSMYQEYFAWRKQYDVRLPSFWTEHCCKVCNIVREVGKQPKTIQNLAKWFES
ncbi:4-galactosyl-N-acetylglucosaminide 3-alpha-L-fucosyltransferase 9-like [Ahaetulla prasina]|uniref:4-galactosyl-N-acetylglucosaminide 3-alpha-L-fucosyltransferase 9-like n=1 Tax=Ahaetulla prasina TaxID=499056 RepID=UPI002647DD04|nr:4-galactosyl-N-acetylglucosaminide 3-alpha-L-fucosyltransferase 9-like [Ahaetulla prasina]